jgi:hypothetical protein
MLDLRGEGSGLNPEGDLCKSRSTQKFRHPELVEGSAPGDIFNNWKRAH